MSRKRPLPFPHFANEQAGNRHAGAPLGNSNALKHGFYSRAFRLRENRDLDSCQFYGLNDEIRLMRVYIRRILDTDSSSFTPAENLAFWRAFSLAMLALTRLVRTNNQVVDPQADFGNFILQVANDVRLGLEAQNEAESQAKEKEKIADSSFTYKPLFPSDMNPLEE